MKEFCTGGDRQYVEGQGQYGCISNCGDASKESDACGINCSEKDNQCYGWTPGMRHVTNPHDIFGRPKLGDSLLSGGAGIRTNPPAPTGKPLPPPSAPPGKLN